MRRCLLLIALLLSFSAGAQQRGQTYLSLQTDFNVSEMSGGATARCDMGGFISDGLRLSGFIGVPFMLTRKIDVSEFTLGAATSLCLRLPACFRYTPEAGVSCIFGTLFDGGSFGDVLSSWTAYVRPLSFEASFGDIFSIGFAAGLLTFRGSDYPDRARQESVSRVHVYGADNISLSARFYF